MEGTLHVPPDRGTIIGRAIWKARYVVVDVPRDQRQRQLQLQTAHAIVKSSTAYQNQLPQDRVSTPRSPTSFPPESMFLSIFKNKGDIEPVQQHAIASITDCQVHMIAHRKQGPVLPTLVINISPDPTTDKLRKRRSSRTAGLTTTKETTPSTLWFRASDDSQHQNKHVLYEWCRFIQSLMQQLTINTTNINTNIPGPLSPLTPASPTFINPFSSPRARDTPEFLPQSQFSPRPGSDNRAAGLNRKASNQTSQTSQTTQTTFSSRERPKTFSESPSLRSRRSDLSHASSTVPPHVTPGWGAGNGNGGFSLPMFPHRPADLPSPATTVGESQGEFIEGWTSAQGRSSTLSSAGRGRDSVSSQPSQTTATTPSAVISSSSPPVPRETILDRAFQMRFIPGSEREIPGEEKLSSLARFDALMREAELRGRQKNKPVQQSKTTASIATTAAAAAAPEAQPRSEFDFDEDDSDKDDSDQEGSQSDEDDVAGSDTDSIDERARRQAEAMYMRRREQLDPVSQIPTNAQRALDFIASRHNDSPDRHRKSRAATTSGLPIQIPSSTSSSSSFAKASSRVPSGRGGGADYDAQTLKALHSGYHPSAAQQQQTQQEQQLLRPQTGYARNRPPIAQRTHSQPQLAALITSSHAAHLAALDDAPFKAAVAAATAAAAGPVSSATVLRRSATASAVVGPASAPLAATAPPDNRQSASSTKHLSFSEFTKRLSSSTSSLLLVQTNVSSTCGSSAGAVSTGGAGSGGGAGAGGTVGVDIVHEDEPPAAHGDQRRHYHPGQRMLPPPPPPAERCGWRGSVGVFGTDGGFL